MSKVSKLIFAAPLLATVCHAQMMPTAVQQADSVNQRRQIQQGDGTTTNAIPDLYQGENADVGPQNVLLPRPKRSLVEAAADVQYFYTDNMLLANHGRQEADVMVSTIQVALAPTPIEFASGSLSPRIGYQHQWFNYGFIKDANLNTYNFNTQVYGTAKLNFFDFNSSTVLSDVSWRKGNVVLGIGADFRRYLDSGDYREFYREYVPRWWARREFSIDQNKGISFTYEGDYRVTDSVASPIEYDGGFNDRLDNAIVVVGSWKLCEHALLQPYYRAEFAHYTAINRDDFQNSFGLTLFLPITKDFYARTFVGYDNVASNGKYANSFERFDAGAGLNFGLRF